VGKVRLNATMTQNVVTYTVEINTDNPGGKLLPYLTANVKFIVGERKDVLLVPNAALRWTPTQVEQIVPEFRTSEKEQKAETTSRVKPAAKAGKEEPARGVVWVPQGARVRPIFVALGLSDGSLMEVSGGDLKDGTLVVVGEMENQAGKPAPGGSPFAPQLFRGSSQPGQKGQPGQGR
jgi:HlyD family secretion protein